MSVLLGRCAQQAVGEEKSLQINAVTKTFDGSTLPAIPIPKGARPMLLTQDSDPQMKHLSGQSCLGIDSFILDTQDAGNPDMNSNEPWLSVKRQSRVKDREVDLE